MLNTSSFNKKRRVFHLQNKKFVIKIAINLSDTYKILYKPRTMTYIWDGVRSPDLLRRQSTQKSRLRLASDRKCKTFSFSYFASLNLFATSITVPVCEATNRSYLYYTAANNHQNYFITYLIQGGHNIQQPR